MCYAICINISYLLDIELLCVDRQCKACLQVTVSYLCCYYNGQMRIPPHNNPIVRELGGLQPSTNYWKLLLKTYVTAIVEPGLRLIPTSNVLSKVDHRRCVGGILVLMQQAAGRST